MTLFTKTRSELKPLFYTLLLNQVETRNAPNCVLTNYYQLDVGRRATKLLCCNGADRSDAVLNLSRFADDTIEPVRLYLPFVENTDMYGQHFQQSMDQPGMVPNPARGHMG